VNRLQSGVLSYIVIVICYRNLVLVLLVVEATSSKKPKVPSFQIGSE